MHTADGHEENDMMRPIIFQVPPPAPGNLTAVENTTPPLSVLLTWTDNSASETGFTVQRDDTGPNFAPGDTITTVATVGPSSPTNQAGEGTSWGGAITAPDSSVVSGTTYYYRVQAVDDAFKGGLEQPYNTTSALLSVWSNTASVSTVPIAPTVTFTGAPATAAYNTSFTVTATTNASTMPTITGTTGVCTVGAVLGTPANATAVVTMTAGSGTCLLTATWAADLFFTAGTATQTTTATPAAQTVSFTGAPASAAYNATFTITATTNSSSMPTITGTAGVCTVGTVGGTAANATATVTMTSGTGSCTLTASWAADANYLAAGPLTQTTTATKIAPTVTFTGAPASAVYNTGFTVTATTNASTTPTITSAGVCTVGALGGTQASTTAPVTMTSGTGSCSLTASWAADANYNTATLTQSTTAALATPTVGFTGAPGTAVYNTSFGVSATTTAGVAPTITGNSVCSAGPVSGISPASATILMISGTGTCTVTAQWPATTNYAAASATQSTTAQKAASTTTIGTPTPNPSVVGQPVAVSFTVTGTGAVPTGTVTVLATSGESCTAAVSVGTCSIIFNSTGTRTMTATYNGDTNFATSSAGPTPSQNVINFTLTITPTSISVNGGQKAVYTVTATAISNGVVMPVSLSCGVNQSHYSCSVSPTLVSPNGGPKKATVTILTVKGFPNNNYTVTVNGVYLSGNPLTGGLTGTVTARLGVKN